MNGDVRDRSGCRAHSHADSPRFEGRPRRRGRAQNPPRLPQDDLAVGAEVDEGAQTGALVNPGGENPGQQIGTDEPAEARQKSHLRFQRKVPSELPRVQHLLTVVRRPERHRGQRGDVDPAEQMVHGSVARQQNRPHVVSPRKPRDHRAQALADRTGQIRRSAIEGESDASHDVRPVRGLWVQCCLDSQHRAGPAIHRLRHERRRAEVDRHAHSAGGYELDGSIVAQAPARPTARPPAPAALPPSRSRPAASRRAVRPG